MLSVHVSQKGMQGWAGVWVSPFDSFCTPRGNLARHHYFPHVLFPHHLPKIIDSASQRALQRRRGRGWHRRSGGEEGSKEESSVKLRKGREQLVVNEKMLTCSFSVTASVRTPCHTSC